MVYFILPQTYIAKMYIPSFRACVARMCTTTKHKLGKQIFIIFLCEKTMAAKKPKAKINTRSPEKYEYAYLLFMQTVPAQDICARVGISAPTLKSWKVSGGWEGKRASRTISMDDLMQKALQRINDLLDNKEDFSADAFAKAVKQLKELKTSNTVDDDINCFMSFQDFLIQGRATYRELTDEFIKGIAKYQDIYIQFRLGNGKLPGK